MDNFEKIMYRVMCVMLLLISMTLIFVGKALGEANDKNEELTQRIIAMENKLPDIEEDISGVTNEVRDVKNELQEEIDSQQQQLATQKNIQHNTNQALIRVNKEIANKESEIQELREELKK